MNKNVWTWALNHHNDKGYRVSLHKKTLWDETKSAFGGWLLNHSYFHWQYLIASKLITRSEYDQEDLLELPITAEQAKLLGWDLED